MEKFWTTPEGEEIEIDLYSAAEYRCLVTELTATESGGEGFDVDDVLQDGYAPSIWVCGVVFPDWVAEMIHRSATKAVAARYGVTEDEASNLDVLGPFYDLCARLLGVEPSNLMLLAEEAFAEDHDESILYEWPTRVPGSVLEGLR